MSKRILDLQARFTEVGRIRLGEKIGNRPAKLEKLRFTSPSRVLIDQISAAYEGKTRPWAAPSGEQWETYINAEEIDIVIPPSEDALTTSYEIWSGGGMQRYCDGVTARRPGTNETKKCVCQFEDERECKIKARMIVWLPKVESLGVWRLETGSWYAAGELTQMVDTLLKASMNLQRAVYATLRLDQRIVKRDGKTFKFNVPVISPTGDIAEVLAASAPMQSLPEARDAYVRPEPPALTAAPETTVWPSDAPENLEGYEEEISTGVTSTVIEEREQQKIEDADEAVVDKPVHHEDDVIDKPEHVRLMITLTAINFTDTERHELVKYVTDGRTESSKELHYGDMSKMWERLTTRATLEVQKLFKVLWAKPTVGWEAMHKFKGLEGKVNDWKLNEWLLALKHVEALHTEMLAGGESESSE